MWSTKGTRPSTKQMMDIGRKSQTTLNSWLQSVIRIGQVRDAYSDHECDEDELVVLDENPPCPELEVNADIFKEIVKDVPLPPPQFITAVGISAVSDEFMMTLWSEIIAE